MGVVRKGQAERCKGMTGGIFLGSAQLAAIETAVVDSNLARKVEEAPELALPVYMLVVSFGLADIGLDDGPVEIAPGTHRFPGGGAINLEPVTLDAGDVLIRHPWALHRGTPNVTDIPRALLTIRYVRRWYADDSREVCSIPVSAWRSLTAEQQSVMRFPVEGQVST